MSTDTEILDLLVVGAGPSGLAYALGAEQAMTDGDRSLRIAILEAADRPGGWVHTRKVGDYALETGPYGYLDKHPELGKIVSLLGLEDQVANPAEAAKRRFVLARGKLRAMPSGPLSFLFSRILTLGGKLRLIREPWAKPHPGGDETVAAFATRRLGPQAAEALVVPMFTGIYAGDPDRASLAACFPRMAELERDYGGLFRALWNLRKKVKKSGQGVGAPRGLLTSFRGGLGALTTALSSHFGDRLKLACPAAAVHRDGELYRVDAAGGQSFRARRVVFATPASRAATLLGALDSELGRLLSGIPYTGVSVVHTAYPKTGAHRIPNGFGFLTPRHAKRDLLGSVFVSTIYPDLAPKDVVLLRNVLGGALRPELIGAPEGALIDTVGREHRELLKVRCEPVFVDVERYENALPCYEVGHLDRVDAIEQASARHPGLKVTGNALYGIGLADCLAKNFTWGQGAFSTP